MKTNSKLLETFLELSFIYAICFIFCGWDKFGILGVFTLLTGLPGAVIFIFDLFRSNEEDLPHGYLVYLTRFLRKKTFLLSLILILFFLNSCNNKQSYEQAVIQKQHLNGNDKVEAMLLEVKAEEEIHGIKIINDFNDFDYHDNHYHFFIQYDDLGSGGVFFFKNGIQVSGKEYMEAFFEEKGYVLSHYGPQTFDRRYKFSDGKTEAYYYENKGEVNLEIYPARKGGLWVQRIEYNY